MESQSALVNAARQHDTFTANGAVTHSTSLNSCVDMFFIAGASRKMDDADILKMFTSALVESPVTALRILAWARDARGGAGERRFFTVIMAYLQDYKPDLFVKILPLVPEFGYYKDIFKLRPNRPVIEMLAEALADHDGAPKLVAKWYPRKGVFFNSMCKYLKKSPKEFRRMLVDGTAVVENKMCSKQWSLITYKHVPSQAMNKYRKAFLRNDADRFTGFINDVAAGKEQINAATLFPHQLYQAFNRGEMPAAVEAQWNALPNYMEGSTERILPVCDVSSSMMGLPMEVSVSLGLYISQRNEGLFKDAFITFNDVPDMIYTRGTFSERLRQISRAPWGGSTNIQSTFQLILDSAKRVGLPQDQMPTKVLIISDMEFNACQGYHGRNVTNLQAIAQQYQESGYYMPELIFWNVNGRVGNVPASINDQGVGLVSGFSPSILKSILQGKIESPKELMLRTVNAERYSSKI